ncbi:Plasma kallikrein [Bulinus truncatus]|nr:Plasma kallikrein [Bulinus truncatus]
MELAESDFCLTRCGNGFNFYSRFVTNQSFLDSYKAACLADCQASLTSVTSTGTTTLTASTTSTKTTISTTPTTTSTTPTTTSTTPTTTSTTPTTTSTTPTTTSTSPATNTLSCGRSSYLDRSRVIGGHPAKECEFPWMVAVSVGNFFCGGTIVDSRRIVSAAHCFLNRYTQELAKLSSVTVKVGSSNRNKTKPYFVQSITLHPRYKHSYKDYDVAVLTLSESLVFTNCTAPICLPSVGEDARDTSYCQAAGWGLIFDTAKSLPYELMKVLLPVVDNSLCLRTYGSLVFNDLKICAGDMYYGGIDTCDGDSGGPLMCFDDGRYVLHGITSFSVSPTCGDPRYIGIYTRVANSEILTFILSNIN